jgi:hypothetical protein
MGSYSQWRYITKVRDLRELLMEMSSPTVMEKKATTVAATSGGSAMTIKERGRPLALLLPWTWC